MITMRGSKLTSRSIFYSKDGNRIITSDDPLPSQLKDRKLILMGKVIRKKKTFRGST